MESEKKSAPAKLLEGIKKGLEFLASGCVAIPFILLLVGLQTLDDIAKPEHRIDVEKT